jgi:hypothetical protein
MCDKFRHECESLPKSLHKDPDDIHVCRNFLQRCLDNKECGHEVHKKSGCIGQLFQKFELSGCHSKHKVSNSSRAN